MAEDEKKLPWNTWDGELQPNSESSGKASHEADRYERGVGNRKPEGPPRAKNELEFKAEPLYKLNLEQQGAWIDSRREAGADQKTFYQVAQGRVSDLELASASINVTEAKARVTGAKIKAEGSVVHAEVDLTDKIQRWLFGEEKSEEPPIRPRSMPLPGAARLSDFVSHGGALFPGTGSNDVFVDGLPAWRAGIDLHFCTAAGPPHGVGTVATPTQTSVLINGFPATRAGDVVVEATGGINMIVVGSSTVFIGSPVPSASDAPCEPAISPEPPSVTLDAVLKADLLAAEGSADLYGEVDLPKAKGIVEAQGGAVVAVAKAELPLKVKIPIPGTEYSVGLGLTLEGAFASSGVEAGGGFAINQDGKLFDLTGGAKAGYGLGGAGVKFGLDISK